MLSENKAISSAIYNLLHFYRDNVRNEDNFLIIHILYIKEND